MVTPGDQIVFVISDGDSPRTTQARVESTDPLTVVVSGSEWGDSLRLGQKVSLILRGGSAEGHGEATISEITKYGLSVVARFGPVEWVTFERRRAPRFPVSLEGDLLIVDDANAGPEVRRTVAEVTDISFYGCQFATDTPLERGTLVAVALSVNPGEEPMRFLGIVTRQLSGPGTFGVEFFDYQGNSQVRLNEFLRGLSAAA